jgi:hypothetical protein
MRINALIISVLSLVLVFIGGCSSSFKLAQTASAGRVGCSPSDIDITDFETQKNARSWKATCNNKTYFCSGVVASSGGGYTDVNCAAK